MRNKPKVNNKNTKTQKWHRYDVYTGNPKHTSQPAPGPSVPTLSKQMPNGI